jgi:hypothetical protein
VEASAPVGVRALKGPHRVSGNKTRELVLPDLFPLTFNL